MLRLIFLITVLLLIDSFFVPQSNLNLTRLTNTPEHAVNLNPSLSDSGRVVVFESSADVLRGGESTSFHAFRVELDGESLSEIARTRAVSPALSSDGKIIVFASTEDLVGRNGDRNSEIFMFDGSGLKQLTESEPDAKTLRLTDGNFRNNSEIYLTSLAARPEFGTATVVNAASQGREPEKDTQIAPGSIATIRGKALAFRTESASFAGSEPPFTVAGTQVKVNGQPARIFYTSPDEVVFAVPSGLSNGPAQFVVTNSDGFSSKAEAAIVAAAPGVFTVLGDGRGEAIILNSETLTPAPFDPSKSPLHLCVFVTGVALVKNVSVTINGKSVTVETVSSSGLKGLDEIHILVPSELSGAGTSTLIVTADGVQSNSVTVELGGITPPESSPQIVISQIFGGGGNAGSPLRNDFIEVFNSGNTAVSLAGWSVQYASATASTWSVTPLTSITLSPGQYYLIQESSGGGNGAPLPSPDATGTIAMAAASGKVVLVRNTSALTGTCPINSSIVDMVGYGTTANCFRGSAPAPAASNTNALSRLANGCQNLGNNATDFATGPPNPKNTNALTRICTDN